MTEPGLEKSSEAKMDRLLHREKEREQERGYLCEKNIS